MKFPRNARILRSQLDAAPLASVFFLLIIFMMLGSLIYIPGIHLQLPGAADLSGSDKPTVTVTVDANNRIFYASRLITEAELKARLQQAVTNSSQPLTLVVQADKAVSYDSVFRLALLAREAGIHSALLAAQPRM